MKSASRWFHYCDMWRLCIVFMSANTAVWNRDFIWKMRSKITRKPYWRREMHAKFCFENMINHVHAVWRVVYPEEGGSKLLRDGSTYNPVYGPSISEYCCLYHNQFDTIYSRKKQGRYLEWIYLGTYMVRISGGSSVNSVVRLRVPQITKISWRTE
jgi:hypothetical protein